MQSTKYPLDNANTSGQGYSSLVEHHYLKPICNEFGYAYTHSVNVGTLEGNWRLYHCFDRAGHKVSFTDEGDLVQTCVSTGSGHKHTVYSGKGFCSTDSLRKHLGGKSFRYSELSYY